MNFSNLFHHLMVDAATESRSGEWEKKKTDAMRKREEEKGLFAKRVSEKFKLAYAQLLDRGERLRPRTCVTGVIT